MRMRRRLYICLGRQFRESIVKAAIIVRDAGILMRLNLEEIYTDLSHIFYWIVPLIPFYFLASYYFCPY
jgi:hypothetical protein